MRLIKLRGTHNIQFRKFHVHVEYKTQVELTERTIGAAEAFGLGVDGEKVFKIVDSDFDVEYGDICYITGDSGSGKSTILRAFMREFADDVIDIRNLEIDETRPIIDTVGKSLDESLKLLSAVGLNDAFLFLRKFSELSDGQKLRYRIAKLMESGRRVWICDEFTAPLDRDTAKIVAYNLQKFARRCGVTVMVATCNEDLNDDLQPNVRIDKRYADEIRVSYNKTAHASECSLMKEMVIEQGDMNDWKTLMQFHYRSHAVPAPRVIVRMVRNIPARDGVEARRELCGVVVYSWPLLTSFGRKYILPNTGLKFLKEINASLSTISRVVIHPKYRSISLGARLIRESLPMNTVRYAETVAVMAKYNPFFENAGMLRVMEQKNDFVAVRDTERGDKYGKLYHINVKSLTDALTRCGFDCAYISSPAYVKRKLSALNDTQICDIKDSFSSANGKNAALRRKIEEQGNALLEYVIVRVAIGMQPKVYLAFDREWLTNPELREFKRKEVEERIKLDANPTSRRVKNNKVDENMPETKPSETKPINVCVNARPFGESSDCSDFNAADKTCRAVGVKCPSIRVEQRPIEPDVSAQLKPKEKVVGITKTKKSDIQSTDKSLRCPTCGKPVKEIPDRKAGVTWCVCAKCKKSWKKETA